MNFYKRYMGDYTRDTAHLSLAEHGAYALMLDHYYSTEQPLPAEPAALYRICRAFEKCEQKAVMSVAEAFFPIADDGLRHNARADRQMPADLRAIETARVNGRSGGRPKKQTQSGTGREPKKNPVGFQNGTENEPGTKTHQTPDSREEQKQKSLERQAARFEEFWAAYPVKKGRADALAKWKARGLDALADQIIADVQARQLRDRQWRDGYIPHGSTYVNGRGWEDAIEVERRASEMADDAMAVAR